MKSDRDKFSIFYMGILTWPRSPALSVAPSPVIMSGEIPMDVHSDRQTLFFVRFGQLRDRQLENIF